MTLEEEISIVRLHAYCHTPFLRADERASMNSSMASTHSAPTDEKHFHVQYLVSFHRARTQKSSKFRVEANKSARKFLIQHSEDKKKERLKTFAMSFH